MNGVNGTHNELVIRSKEEMKFGRELREKEFLFDDGFLNMNHGSFGTYPRSVRTAFRAFQDAAEGQPDHFIRYKYPQLLDDSRAAMAKLINAPVETIVFVPNATTGINTVLRNLTYHEGEHILYFSSIYGSCEKTVAYITENTPASSKKVSLTYPVEDDWLISEFESAVKQVEAEGGKVKVAIFDTVVSMPGVRVPYERLTQKCKELGILSCVDGAHGVGHVDLDFSSFQPDFFVSNCHKWLHVPRGCAILYVPVKHQPLIRTTLPTSHGFMPSKGKINSPLPKSTDPKKTPFISNFEFVGSIDNAPYLCVPEGLKFRESLGGEKVIREYIQKLVYEGTHHIAKVLGTSVLDNSTQTLTQCCMANVLLPIDLVKAKEHAKAAVVEEEEVGGVVRDWISKVLIDDYNTFIPSLFFGDKWWARLSGQVYLEMADFEYSAGVLKEVCERVEKGEWALKK